MKKVIEPRTFYRCDECSRDYKSMEDASYCEKRHEKEALQAKCTHKDASYYGLDNEIYLDCRECGKCQAKYLNLDHLSYRLLKTIWHRL